MADASSGCFSSPTPTPFDSPQAQVSAARSPPRKCMRVGRRRSSLTGEAADQYVFDGIHDERAPFSARQAYELKMQAQAAYGRKDFRGAIELYGQALHLNPSDTTSLGNRAACYMMQRRYDLAIMDCQTAVNIEPGFVRGYSRIGKIYLLFGSTERARKWYQSAQSYCDPSDQKTSSEIRTYINYCNQVDSIVENVARNLRIDPSRMLADVTRGLEISPLSRDLNIFKISLLLELHEEDKAGDIFSALYPALFDEPWSEDHFITSQWTLSYNTTPQVDIKLVSSRAAPRAQLLYYVNVLMMQNQLERAQFILERLPWSARYAPKVESCLERVKSMIRYKEEGIRSYNQERYDCAVTHYTSALRCCIESCYRFLSIIYCNRAAAYAKLNRLPDAIQDCNLALMKAPAMEKALSRKASYLRSLGRFQESASTWKTLATQHPNCGYEDELTRTIREEEAVRQESEYNQRQQQQQRQQQRSAFHRSRGAAWSPYSSPSSSIRNTYLFDILGLRSDAAQAEIKRRFRELALKYHPDKNSDDRASEKFRLIKMAYKVLTDDAKRERYLRIGEYSP